LRASGGFLALGVGLVYHVDMTTLSGIEIPAPPVPTEEEKYQMTLEAIESTSKGRKIPHSAVVAWTKSLSTKNPLPMPRYEDYLV